MIAEVAGLTAMRIRRRLTMLSAVTSQTNCYDFQWQSAESGA